MKIKSLQISNVLSFEYFEDIANAPIINFDENLSILIGQNGSGKSTVLEVINFIFKRVLFIPYNRNAELYARKADIDSNEKRRILAQPEEIRKYKGFRLEKNYDFIKQNQNIRVVVTLDAVDRANIQKLQDNKEKLSPIVGDYSSEVMFSEGTYQDEYQIDIYLNDTDKAYTSSPSQSDIGYKYLTAYNLYKEVIEIYNTDNPAAPIDHLTEPFSLIGGYRNYNAYAPHVSVGGGKSAQKQIQSIKSTEYSKSASSAEGGEPAIFSLVRLKMAEHCFGLINTKKDQGECEQAANNLVFIKKINEKLKLVNIRVEIKLVDLSNWNFTFSFIDTKRERIISDINALSAGQKAIIHLVFEAYGRGELHGGLVVIDEPEIHLHYQFQSEYLRVIETLNAEQESQYILVTHSESLITSETIESVIRLSLNEGGYTRIHQPSITTNQKWLIKILDNTRSTHAFFGSKVLLVEGEMDRYFFRALLGEIEKKIKKGLIQEIAILDMGGRDNLPNWRVLFQAFGLTTFFIGDLDNAYSLYPPSPKLSLDNPQKVAQFLSNHPDALTKIQQKYSEGMFILKEGDLEIYLGIQKDLAHVIKFCNDDLTSYLTNSEDSKIQELKKMMSLVTGEDKDTLW